MPVSVAGATPPGYVRVDVPHGYAVVHQKLADGVREALAAGTLYAWASTHPDRRQMQGRLPVYAASLPHDGPTVAVRHAQHGGVLAPLLRDLFLPPTRAPRELLTALLLARSGVPTPPVAGYAVYRAGPLLRRADVMTILLPGEDLGAMLRAATGDADRQQLIAPVAGLLGALTQAGAWHPDLNVKNILLVPDDAGELHPAVLDIDRVHFAHPGDPNVREANFRRLERSLARWRAQHGTGFTPDELRALHDRLLEDEAVEATHRALALEAYMPTDLT
ncbi:MAG TPA: lipopolysaccharide kinase InaA family protein [Gemmatimonadaceae bacterium]|nr:lipopolysaccharide kinase InaA family protein [Gemmatimonadaceae bacterium]